jgi:hypothetical protein
MAEKKKEERTLEMRVAELEEMLGVRAEPTEFSEQEVAAYNKIADALGVDPCRVQTCRIQPCRTYPCRTYPCRIYPCRTYPCRIQPCRGGEPCRTGACGCHGCIQQHGISPWTDQCVPCYAGGYEVDWSGGFGTLGY